MLVDILEGSGVCATEAREVFGIPDTMLVAEYKDSEVLVIGKSLNPVIVEITVCGERFLGVSV